MRILALCVLLLSCVRTQKVSSIQKCNERIRWKFEDYTKKPLFANQIFTKGYGIHIVYESKNELPQIVRDSMSFILLSGFRAALTTWGVSLIANKSNLSKDIVGYLDAYSFKTGNNYTYNAPQIFSVDCIENANFVIRVYTQNGKKFKDSKQILAKAQIQGRTIIINMQNHQMIYNQKLFQLKSGLFFNIVPILAHELGHSFGLSHQNEGKSIMASSAKSISNFPLMKDGQNFADVLGKQIKGGAPGYFNPTECVGLRL